MVETTDSEKTEQPEQRPRMGPSGLGSGPVIAAGMMFAGGVVVGGIGLGTMAFGEDEAQVSAGDESTVQSSAEPKKTKDAGDEDEDQVTVTLPDEDGNGIADALEKNEDAARQEDDSSTTDPGSAGVEETRESQTEVYIIEYGDTLSEISAETGVPVGTLVDANDIADPNLIYAGSALLIPPVP